MNQLKVLLFCSLVLVASGQSFSRLKDALGDQLNKVMGTLDQSLDQLLGQLNGNLNNIESCFVADVGGINLNIFNRSQSFKSIVQGYFEAFPDKGVSPEGVKNLLDSARDITTRCSDSNRGNSSVKYGFTSMSDKSVDEMNEMMGHKVDAEESEQKRRKRLTGDDQRCQPSDNSAPEEVDWRSRNVVTPVRNQGQCGSCWTFASVASLESALLINGKTDKSVDELDLSEQQLVQCAKFMGRGCQGGTSQMAFSYIDDHGVTYEKDMPYRAQNGFCPLFRSFSNKVTINNYCIRSRQRYSLSMSTEEINESDMQRTVAQFGPLYVAINADPLKSRNYRGGVIDDPSCSTQVNHAVTLVGYTSNSWIIKNSWGSNWGDGGYFQLARGHGNICGILTEMAWPLV